MEKQNHTCNNFGSSANSVHSNQNKRSHPQKFNRSHNHHKKNQKFNHQNNKVIWFKRSMIEDPWSKLVND
ncbi:hypothetical protein O181_004797 [Austropuccinia psidii MF-1]|uniref:Uncharacterized protein n=1 Tax=Austropuccinia psidii MF-1 TaxID=1389203 RepID=A0A9Q3BH02_9BASI|nr:hypothetical protein [Austropuccinia psidii MF-1]